jgi:transposase
MYARQDIDLSRSTLADMVGQVAVLVRPVVDALSRYVMAGERVHGDDIPRLPENPARGLYSRLGFRFVVVHERSDSHA